MAGAPLGTSIVTVLRPIQTVKDAYGNDVPDRRNVVYIDLRGCAVHPDPGAETLPSGRDVVMMGWRVHAPGAADVRATDQVRFAGVVYEVDGEPRVWPAPWGGVHHTEFRLKAVLG